MKLNIATLGTAFPKQETFFYMNWMPGGVNTMYDLAETAKKYHVGLGGPDVHPDVNMQSYPAIHAFKDDVTVMMDIQWSNYDHTKRYGDTEELYTFSTSYLGAKYLCWMPRNGLTKNILKTIHSH